jgi:hypothetical protein
LKKFFIFLFIILPLASVLSACGNGQDKIAALEAENQQLIADNQALIADNQALQDKLSSAEKAISDLEAQVSAANATIQKLQEEISATKESPTGKLELAFALTAVSDPVLTVIPVTTDGDGKSWWDWYTVVSEKAGVEVKLLKCWWYFIKTDGTKTDKRENILTKDYRVNASNSCRLRGHISCDPACKTLVLGASGIDTNGHSIEAAGSIELASP